MSERITLPAARIPLVDGQGRITREWLVLLNGLFKRAGGTEGFSNQELFGDVCGLQSYDELLERIGATETQQRQPADVAQMQDLLSRLDALEQQSRQTQEAVFYQQAFPQDVQIPVSKLKEVLDALEVKGVTLLATEKGQVLIGLTTSSTPEQLQVAKSVRLASASGERVHIGSGADDGVSKLQVDGKVKAPHVDAQDLDATTVNAATVDAVHVNAGEVQADAITAPEIQTTEVLVGAKKVLGARQGGVAAYTAYPGQTMPIEYDQAAIQELDDAARTASEKLEQVVTALRTHGLIGD